MQTSENQPDAVQSAKDAGLRYASDSRPGIKRLRSGKGFRYITVDGLPLREKEALARIKSLVIPPAWRDVWICPHASGHLQVTGRDARGRKQSRYHPRWRQVRDETKYERMLAFGKALPAIRKQVAKDMALAGLCREKVLATVVRLLEVTSIRVGNPEYARDNHSYGLTTMRGRHVQVEGSSITFKFQGKSGVRHTIGLQDRRMANILKRCLDLPGYELFQYEDEQGGHAAVDSTDVNRYLQAIAKEPFTAKDFRTWAGTVLACIVLGQCESFETPAQAKKNVTRAIEQVAARLGNTPSVCRKCYVHPAVLDCYMDGSLVEIARRTMQDELPEAGENLRREELALLRFLDSRLSAEGAKATAAR